MYCYLSTSCFRNIKLHEAIKLAGKLSNKHVEISAPHPYETLNNLKNILKDYKKKNYKFSFHNYFPTPKKSFVLNMASEDTKIKNNIQEMFDNVLALSETAGNNIYGVHAGYRTKAVARGEVFKFEKRLLSYERALTNSVSFVNDISPKFKKKNVNFLIENLFPSKKIYHSLFCTFDQIKDFMTLVDDNVGILIDLGHLNISSKIYSFNKLKTLDKILDHFSHKIKEIHISENNGLKDEHKTLTKNSWQYDALKMISKTKKKNILYCLESRNADGPEEIHSCLGKINSIIN